MASGLIRDLIEWRPPPRKTIGELLGTPRALRKVDDATIDAVAGGRLEEDTETVELAREKLNTLYAERNLIIEGRKSATPDERKRLGDEVNAAEVALEEAGLKRQVPPSRAADAALTHAFAKGEREDAVRIARERLADRRRTANDVVTRRAQMSAKERRELRTDISALEIGLIDARERP